jgi:ribosomal protein L7/L12
MKMYQTVLTPEAEQLLDMLAEDFGLDPETGAVRKIRAVRYVRTIFGCTLREAVEFIQRDSRFHT